MLRLGRTATSAHTSKSKHLANPAAGYHSLRQTSPLRKMTSPQSALPAPSTDQSYVSVSALRAGTLTLPIHLFSSPCDPSARLTVPSLSFLIQHPACATNRGHAPTRILFDLGLRNPLDTYPPPIRKHIETRRPISSTPDVVQGLERGGLTPDDVDWVFLSHVHWDHIGSPSRFLRSKFLVGHGSMQLLSGGGDTRTGGHAHFEKGLLPMERTIELPPASRELRRSVADAPLETGSSMQWQSLAHFSHAIDFFGDGSLYLIDAPGHLQGHTNILARTGPGRWVYLAGDACHDRKILTGESQIAAWKNDEGRTCCIHVDKEETERTIERIRMLMESEGSAVEVVLAHDVEWAGRKENAGRFWPGML